MEFTIFVKKSNDNAALYNRSESIESFLVSSGRVDAYYDYTPVIVLRKTLQDAVLVVSLLRNLRLVQFVFIKFNVGAS